MPTEYDTAADSSTDMHSRTTLGPPLSPMIVKGSGEKLVVHLVQDPATPVVLVVVRIEQGHQGADVDQDHREAMAARSAVSPGVQRNTPAIQPGAAGRGAVGPLSAPAPRQILRRDRVVGALPQPVDGHDPPAGAVVQQLEGVDAAGEGFRIRLQPARLVGAERVRDDPVLLGDAVDLDLVEAVLLEAMRPSSRRTRPGS